MDATAQTSQRQNLEDCLRFFQSEAHILLAHPELFFQQAANEPDHTALATCAKQRWEKGTETRPWVRWTNKPNHVNASVMTLTGHVNHVEACTYSPDGSQIVSAAAQSSTLRIWDSETGRPLFVLQGHAPCAYSPDSRSILSGTSREMVASLSPQADWDLFGLAIWDAETGVPRKALVGHKEEIRSCAFSPNGLLALSAGSIDSPVKIWDLETGEVVRRLKGTAPCVFSPDGRRIVFLSGTRLLKVWDLEERKLISKMPHATMPNACAFSPDGLKLVSAGGHSGESSELKIWDAETGKLLFDLKGHRREVCSCAFSPDGRTVISGSEDCTVRLWDAATGSELAVLEVTPQLVNAVAFSPDGQRLVSGGGAFLLPSDVKVWDVHRALGLTQRGGHKQPIHCCAFSPDARRVVTGSIDQSLKLWEVDSGEELSTLTGHEHWVGTCAYSPDGCWIVSGSMDNTVRVWNAETGATITKLTGHSTWVDRCEFSADGVLIISASKIGGDKIRLWHRERAEELASFEGKMPFACSPDGRRIVSFSESNNKRHLRLWDVATSSEVFPIEGEFEEVYSCTFLPDGSRVLFNVDREKVKAWSANTGKPIPLSNWIYGSTNVVSPDGRVILTSSKDELLLSELRTGDLVSVLNVRYKGAAFCAFSPDGRRILVKGSDKWFTVWDIEDGFALSFYCDGIPVPVTQDSTGRLIAIGSSLGTLQILTLAGIKFGAPVITAVRLWQYSFHWWDRFTGTKPHGMWAKEITFQCSWCCSRLVTPVSVLDAIRGISRVADLGEDRSPCTDLPTEAWDEPRLLSPCPDCNRPLKFNPFVVDNRDRY